MSVFLDRPESDHVAASALAFAIRDAFPVSPGHTLVIPRRPVATWFDATREEQVAILDLVDVVKRQLDAEHAPDGYNVGFNAGVAAGQTVMHLHVHVIPRYAGDVDDPRGGVRHVVPGKGNYLALAADPLATGGEADPFARHVLPLLQRARQVDIVSAFVQESGLARIEAALQTALDAGAQVRLVTGDYLAITQASALELLLDWQSARRDDEGAPGRLEARVVEVDRLPGRSRAFHPKAWHLAGEGFGVAFVGSSNLSRSALDTGVEWNLRVDRATNPAAFHRVRSAFEALWGTARPLDAAWVEAYARRAKLRQLPLPAGETEPEPLPALAEPHAVQAEALAALREGRSEGRRRALVVLATGLGKTWLAAFDYRQLWDELGRQPRLLFVAHRRELLRQAARAYRSVVQARGGDARIGWFVEESADLDAPLVFASVAKLARPAWLARLADLPFDYVVVDEVHHAAAGSYRRILAAVTPAFLLGLTATPDRADAADVEGQFDDFVAYRADIGRGIDIGRLVPFRYMGVKDEIDYANIPWRSRRFDPDALAAAAQTDARMRTLWAAWQANPGTRTLVFCCSIAHVDFAAGWLAGQGVRVDKVYSGPGSDDRDLALERLADGRIDAICAVDVFNEGVDVPALDRVVLLRPTESRVVFLQQLGRGLRAAAGKDHLTIVDFVGNHQVFLDRLRTLLALGGREAARLSALLAEGHLDLPDGCSVHLELEAKRLLEQRFRAGGADEVERTYRQLKASRGERPTAGELVRTGASLEGIRRRNGSWLGFVAAEGDLDPDQRAAWEVARGFLAELETTPMTKSFKMVTLQALLDADALASGMDVAALADRAWDLLSRSPELLRDVPDGDRPVTGAAPSWVAYWRRNPVAAWTAAKKQRRTWFRLDADRLGLDVEVMPGLDDLVRELVDVRLAQYRRRAPILAEGFVCRVGWSGGHPMLEPPARHPVGDLEARLPDGSTWGFQFGGGICDVARPVAAAGNQLPELLRRWFGPYAGQPGAAFEVRLRASPDGLWAEPVQESRGVLTPLHAIVGYPDLRAAAGHADAGVEPPDASRVLLPVAAAGPDRFAVRVSGTSMDGGKAPMRDGDWAVLQLARGAPVASVVNRVVLVQVPGAGHGSAWQLKRLVAEGAGFQLVSDHPDGPSFPTTADTVVIARLDRVVRPEELAPAVGAVIPADALADRFGIDELGPRTGRAGGHHFVIVDAPGMLATPTTVRSPGTGRPSETAYVLAKRDGDFRYLGVGRWSGGVWEIPEVDFATWRAFGAGREASRALPAGALERARSLVSSLPPGAAITRPNGSVARIVGVADRGGIRIDGGAEGTGPRTVSLTDLAWVLVAADDVAAHGGLLDEARVNRLRYLDGTPKGSTRFIDTGWAIATWMKARG